MIRLTRTLANWKTPAFASTFKQEVEALCHRDLPLQQCLTQASAVADSPFTVVYLGAANQDNMLNVRAKVFYAGIIAGCSCADDPTPANEIIEHCTLRFAIDMQSAETHITEMSEDHPS